MGALDPQRCRPFARDRLGTVFGEGAAALVLESAEHASARGVSTVYARVAGAGWSCDAYHPTAPEPAGTQIARAMADALTDAGASVDQVGCVVPHGTGTELNDRIESDAITGVLGMRTPEIPLYSLKALIGHTGGAAGAMAAVAATLILHRGTVPGNVTMAEQDPGCAVWLPQAATPLAGRYAMINAYAFGGNNISLVLDGAR
jgi:3-oxoacyl-(acyl-carrier-protein) synthase